MEYKPFDENFSLAGKTALVTGGGSGIGEAIALMFGRKGADVAAGDMNADAAAKTAATIKGYGRRALGLTADISKPDDVAKAVSAACAELGRLDILVNCAGISFLDDAETFPLDQWRRVLDVNLTGSFIMAQAAANVMIKQGGGKIINMASKAALVYLDNHAAYTASKAALVGLTKVLACEWAQFNIQVNAISPTVIVSDMSNHFWAGEKGVNMKKKIPVGRFGAPEEVAAMAVYLASDASNLVTGANLVIDGGYTVQ